VRPGMLLACYGMKPSTFKNLVIMEDFTKLAASPNPLHIALDLGKFSNVVLS